jgi:RND family efflux transporter MFP subunit
MSVPNPRRLRALLGASAAAALLGSSACLPAFPSVTSSSSAGGSAGSTRSSIRIGKAVRGDLSGVLNFTAEVRPKGQIGIVPRVVAPLAKVNVDPGARVRAGDTLAELDHADLDRQVLEAQSEQAAAEAKLAELKAGPKAEVVAQAQANVNAAQARVRALENTRGAGDAAALQRRVDEARSNLAQAQAAARPDPQAIAQADEAVNAAVARLTQLQSDPARQNDRAALDAARADVQRVQQAAVAARTPSGSQAAVDQARNELDDAQQALLLVRLSQTAFDLDQARALASVADAQLKLATAPAAPEEIKAAETRVERAYAQAELARARLRDATITAPVAGIVSDISARVGSTVSPAAAIMTLIPPEMQLVVQADETQLAQLQVGQTANVSVDGFPRDAFSGTVKGIAPALDPRTRSVAVQIEVADPQGKLRPGMFAQLAIQTGQRPGAVLVPKDAVLRVTPIDGASVQQTVVYTVAEGRVHRQVVSIGASDARSFEIVQGLNEGVDLVLNPRADFIEGELISAAAAQ